MIESGKFILTLSPSAESTTIFNSNFWGSFIVLTIASTSLPNKMSQVTPKKFAKVGSVAISGVDKSFSHLLTLCGVMLITLAISSCVKPFSFLSTFHVLVS